MDPSKIPNRLTVVQQTYHQLPGEQPRYYDSRFSRELETLEQPYERQTTIGPEWKPLDVGWLNETGVGMLIIENNEGQFYVRIPTLEEKEVTRAKGIEIGIDVVGNIDSFALVPSGESCRFYPANANHLRIRCQSGTAKITIQAFPR